VKSLKKSMLKNKINYSSEVVQKTKMARENTSQNKIFFEIELEFWRDAHIV
jgi:hypothetical protein